MRIKANEITPANLRCGVGPCPAIFKTSRGTIIVVGSVPASIDLPLNVRKKMGAGETAVEIPKSFFKP